TPENLGTSAQRIREAAERARLNFRYFDDGRIGVSVDETTTARDIGAIAHVFAEAARKRSPETRVEPREGLPADLARRSSILTHPVFASHRSETKMMRYLKSLERKDIGLDRSMIPLGSCTMKLNAASEMIPVTWPSFSTAHPFAPVAQMQGY